MQSVFEQALTTDDLVLAYNYDDGYRRLRKTSDDLANEIQSYLKNNSITTLTIDAHSMGARIALIAISMLEKSHLLAGRSVRLNLIAPHLAGDYYANWSRWSTWPFQNIRGVRPALDMGTKCRFQSLINSLRFGDNVQVRVFTAGQDDVIHSENSAYRAIMTNLKAQVIHFPDADHASILNTAAQWLAAHK
jgi:pimeloyl-ACP methyl ester carboxylesterase